MPSVFFISLMAGSPWGGSEELWYKTALYARAKGWSVGCAIYHWPEKEEKMRVLKDAGAEVFYIPNKGRSKRNLLERIQNKVSKARAKAYIETLPVKQYDIVVVNQGAFEVTTPAWREYYKKLDKYIVLYHNYKETEVLTGVKKAAVENWCANAALNLFASRRISEVLESNSNIKPPRAGILLNPISFEPPVSFTPYPALQNGNYRFIMLAALELWRKGQDNLVQALSSDKWKQRKWTLHLYGEGKDKRNLQELVIKTGLQQKVFLEGNTNDPKTVLENAHMLLQLTHIDAMPLSVVEALALGRPVAVSKIGDMPYWISEGENGWISSNASVEQIDTTLERAWNQREDWPWMGENGFDSFKRKFPVSAEENLLQQIQEKIGKV
ncbi:MAG: glycosyltransferase family 4 protein [Flavisolibacter sp.]